MSLYELRTYIAVPGRMPALLERFREHTVSLFAEHGIISIGYWTQDANPDVLVYLVKHDGAPEESWESFRGDPRWITARDASTTDGPITTSIESIFLTPTEFSPLV